MKREIEKQLNLERIYSNLKHPNQKLSLDDAKHIVIDNIFGTCFSCSSMLSKEKETDECNIYKTLAAINVLLIALEQRFKKEPEMFEKRQEDILGFLKEYVGQIVPIDYKTE